MGIQDRDWYGEKNRGGQNIWTQGSNTAMPRLSYLLPLLVAMGIIWFTLSVYIENHNNREPLPVDPIPPRYEDSTYYNKTPGIISIKADRQGHFRGKLLINNVAMPFMIDTGATNTAIPKKLAILANLPMGRKVRTSTAGGYIFSTRTRINQLKIGNVTLRNLDGSINKYLNEVLVGMSTLKHFKMSLNDDTLTLSPKKEAFTYSNTSVPLQPTRKKTAVIKSVICDENTNICHTSYSDH